MPTGYTAPIKDGISFQQFVLGCARAFGATITMRDEPADAAIPDRFEPSDYHIKAIADAQIQLSSIQSLPEEQCEKEALKEYLDACENNQVSREKCIDLRNKYNAMLSEVVTWEPPTSDHVGLKDFMIQQIQDSIKFDCNEGYIVDPIKLSGHEWKAKKLAQIKHSIIYHVEQNKEEIRQANGRTAWVNALRNSL